MDAALELMRETFPGVPDDELMASSWYHVAAQMAENAHGFRDPAYWLRYLRDACQKAISADGEDGTRDALREALADLVTAWHPNVNRYFAADCVISGLPGQPTPPLEVFFGRKTAEQIREIHEIFKQHFEMAEEFRKGTED